ncbi:ribonuclease HII [Paenalcaligenes faecalis]|uniref:ribonuclease HII n=1 Tax=Paenalcaligenes faecalis TaxID=2980099 RepID=UPI0022B9679E|nr:ribonuclease HII [Paenalcaligenes faecalis]
MLADLEALIAQYPHLAGVDEAGRGPLAGPVFAAAVILDPAKPIIELADSKKLSAKRRDGLAERIKQDALVWCIASASTEEIDQLNILQATMLAMQRACQQLPLRPDFILIDGNRVPQDLSAPARAVIKGDDQVPAISAASILAKTARDAACLIMHEQYPQYAFDQHKGYGTKQHMALLEEHGPCPEHRRSFAPVRKRLMTTP